MRYEIPGWALDGERVIQRVMFHREFGEWVEDGVVESLRGTEAWSELSWELSTGEKPIVYPDDCEGAAGEVYGYEYEDLGFKCEYWDCDEVTYSEMFPDED